MANGNKTWFGVGVVATILALYYWNKRKQVNPSDITSDSPVSGSLKPVNPASGSTGGLTLGEIKKKKMLNPDLGMPQTNQEEVQLGKIENNNFSGYSKTSNIMSACEHCNGSGKQKTGLSSFNL
jgi:hypothetical protein